MATRITRQATQDLGGGSTRFWSEWDDGSITYVDRMPRLVPRGLAPMYDGAMGLSVPLGNRSHLPAGLAWSTSPGVAPALGLPRNDKPHRELEPGAQPPSFAWTWFELTTTFKNATGRQ
jgi:hypothetical protein